MAKVGILWQFDTSSNLMPIYRKALTDTLKGLGYVEGRNIQYVERTSTDPRRLPELAKELVDQTPDVLVGASQLTAVELKRATSAIPIVFATAPNPIAGGLVQSLAQPGGNATGLSLMVVDTAGKRLGLFKEAIPSLRRVAIVFDPKEPAYFTNPHVVFGDGEGPWPRASPRGAAVT